MFRALGVTRPARFSISNLFWPSLGDSHDRALGIWHYRKSVALAGRGPSRRTIPDRLANAGHSRGHEARRRHDFAYLDRIHDPGPCRLAIVMSSHAHRRHRELASSLAAAIRGSHALAALCAGAGDNHNRLAVCLVPRLVDLILLS